MYSLRCFDEGNDNTSGCWRVCLWGDANGNDAMCQYIWTKEMNGDRNILSLFSSYKGT